ncbi:unnamed protein product [Phaedon cochleariae]|uniref:Uncharacterized protein n=1 Tax=Phaedon cochleariae TaxID=80249 RepID=A0A9P0DGS5_PHACE|nr:unnamed protein product [Phaedon cochleariae]
MSVDSESYGGSKIFAGWAEYTGLATHQFNFVLCQLVALALATLFRTVFHPSRTVAAIRHLYGLVCGLLIGYFCFGSQAIHLAGLPTVCYAVIRTQSPHVMQGMVLTVALVYISCLHLHRQIFDYGSYALDISGPLMVITQKVSSLAFSLHDGMTKKKEEMTVNQRYHAVYKTPSFIEYFGYTLLFPSLMAGPVIFYNDYIEFIEGSNYTKVQGNLKNSSVVIREPNPVKIVCRKVVVALACAFIFVKFLPRFPISRVQDESFLYSTSLLDKFWYLTVCTTLVRFKYYFAWTMADAICNNSGIGFSGYAEDGSEKWDKISNVDILQFEFATSLKQSIEAWNKGTNVWLRMIVYERTEKHRTLLTYGLSAVWHGFYPGYYLTFLSGALFTFSSRIVRRHVRNIFMVSREAKLFYDIFTFAVTHLVLAYLTFPFVLLEFWSSVILFNQMFWCFHIASILMFLLMPKIIPESDQKNLSSKSGIVFALKQAS